MNEQQKAALAQARKAPRQDKPTEGLNPRQLAELEKVPKLYRNAFLKAFEGKSKSAGIKAFCLACTGFLRAEVANCSARACALHPYRPYQNGEKDEEGQA